MDPTSPGPHPSVEADAHEAAALLDALPAALEALPAPMFDGYLVGVLLQRRPVPAARWWRAAFAEDAAPARLEGPALAPLRQLLESRHRTLEAAIAGRQWFDPWIFTGSDDEAADSDGAATTLPSEAVLPWVAGFAHAMATFEDLGDIGRPELDEPLALLYQHLDPDDLEDADALLALIEELEPPADLTEAVEQLVRATLLIADVTRPVGDGDGPARQPARSERSRAARPVGNEKAPAARPVGDKAPAARPVRPSGTLAPTRNAPARQKGRPR